jgi:hypothetical protein
MGRRGTATQQHARILKVRYRERICPMASDYSADIVVVGTGVVGSLIALDVNKRRTLTPIGFQH